MVINIHVKSWRKRVNYVDAIKPCLFWNQETVYAIVTAIIKKKNPHIDDFLATLLQPVHRIWLALLILRYIIQIERIIKCLETLRSWAPERVKECRKEKAGWEHLYISWIDSMENRVPEEGDEEKVRGNFERMWGNQKYCSRLAWRHENKRVKEQDICIHDAVPIVY